MREASLDDLAARGLIQDSTDLTELRRRLDEGPIGVYCGCPPPLVVDATNGGQCVCPAGQKVNLRNDGCEPCPPGYVCFEGSPLPALCPSG